MVVSTRPTTTRADTGVGLLLRQAREQRGLTIAAVAGELRIPPKHLEALEVGDISVFAAEVYARGAFIKYADYLGVRAEKTQRAFLRSLSGAREYVPLKVHTPRSWLQRMISPRWILALAIASVALLVGVYIAWQVESFLKLPALRLAEPTTTVIQGSTVTVRGQAAPDAQVTINETSVLLNPQGDFVTTLILHPGINVLQVAAKNAAGRTRTITRDLLMPRSSH